LSVVLVTGGSGMLGSHLVDPLRERDRDGRITWGEFVRG
jgi:nucleoside-diphosphate-sugar epimerase